MEHPWSGEEHIRRLSSNQRFIEWLYLLELENVVIEEGFFDLLVLPFDEELIIEISLFDQPRREVNRNAILCSIPVSLQKDRKLLRSSKCEDRNQDLTSSLQGFGNYLQHFPLPVAFGVTDCRGICRFGDDYVGIEFWYIGSSQMPIGVGVIVSGVKDR